MHVISRKLQRLLRVGRRRRRRGRFPAHSTASSDTHIALASPRGNCISRTRDPVMTDNDQVSGRTVERLRRGVWATAPVHLLNYRFPSYKQRPEYTKVTSNRCTIVCVDSLSEVLIKCPWWFVIMFEVPALDTSAEATRT